MLNLIGVLVLALPPGPTPEDAVRNEQKKLEGNWSAVSIEVEGAKMPAQQVNGFSLTFKAGKFTSHNGGEKMTGTYTIDPAKKPKTMDIVHADGPEKGKTWSLIYTLEGNTLRLRGGEIDKDRPGDFETKDQKGAILMIFRHE
jgi:uncharacterized protein (TIGR03067 family)